MDFPDEIAARLVAQGVGTLGTGPTSPANAIFVGSGAVIPTGAGPFLSIIETGGSGASRTQNGTAVARLTASLLSRGVSYAAARALLVAARNALGGDNGLYNVTLSGAFYLSITARQNVTDVGSKDGNNRFQFTYNIDADRQGVS